MISQDHDIEAAVEADLLQAVHQLAHDPVDGLEGHEQLHDQITSELGGVISTGSYCGAFIWASDPVCGLRTWAMTHPPTLGTVAVARFVRFLQIQCEKVWSGWRQKLR